MRPFQGRSSRGRPSTPRLFRDRTIRLGVGKYAVFRTELDSKPQQPRRPRPTLWTADRRRGSAFLVRPAAGAEVGRAESAGQSRLGVDEKRAGAGHLVARPEAAKDGIIVAAARPQATSTPSNKLGPASR